MFFWESVKAIEEEMSRADVLVLGPGIGRSPDVTEFVREIIRTAVVPIVLDADALFAIAEDAEILKALKAPCVLTPHPGEMSRLTGLAVTDILDNMTGAACEFSAKYNLVTLLKDARTIIASPNGGFYINVTGNSALAKAGTGDVLTGMIAGFIAQGSRNLKPHDVFNAAKLGAYIHGKAGEAAAKSKSLYGVTAGDVLENIPNVLNELE
jgi:NAD(P)H-hydrate epimerase